METQIDEIFGLPIHHDWQIEKTYESLTESDGQTTDVLVSRYPAEFFRLEAHEGKNSVGELLPAFALATGSSMRELSHQIAQAIAEGMLGVTPYQREEDSKEKLQDEQEEKDNPHFL